MARPLRAGVIGASGVGKHHAKWFHALGCEVVAFAGTSAQSVAATETALRDLFGFSGQGFVGVEPMLQAAALDLVAICSPPWLHHRHFLQAADAGCHILCEKPVVWDATKETVQLVDEAAQMVGRAREKGLVAAVNTQYVAARAPYLSLCAETGREVDPEGFRRFFMQMDSRGGKYGATGEKVWIDLASHPIGVLAAFAGPGTLRPASAACRITDRQARAVFSYLPADGGREIAAEVVTCNVPEGPLVRRFGIDGVFCDYEGRNDEAGVYCAYLKLDGVEVKATDFVQTSIGRFVGAVRGEGGPLATLEAGLSNLEIQLRLLDIGRS